MILLLVFYPTDISKTTHVQGYSLQQFLSCKSLKPPKCSWIGDYIMAYPNIHVTIKIRKLCMYRYIVSKLLGTEQYICGQNQQDKTHINLLIYA